MQCSAEIINNSVVVKKPRDAGLLHSKSRYGIPLSGNQLQLDLLETVFLVGEGKLVVYEKKKIVDFQSLVRKAVLTIPDFELRYLAFRDLRKRGYFVKQVIGDDYLHFCITTQNKNTPGNQTGFISVVSERKTVTFEGIKALIQKVTRSQGCLWFMIVDEEGDITYYDVTKTEPCGNTFVQSRPKTQGMLLENRVVIFDPVAEKKLREKEFFGKPFGEGLQLSLVEALYLVEQGVLEIIGVQDEKKIPSKLFWNLVQEVQPDIELRLQAFCDLKNRGLIVKTGFKFGTHFRAYTKNPDATHAEYLIHIVPKGFSSIWAEISRAVRLAHSVNKDIMFAIADGVHIEYIKFGRLRP
jgi:tRNA-intron endonuclease